MKITKTGRGFDLITFTDRNGLLGSLQKSSLATEDAIWLGVYDDIVRECRMDTKEGWQDIDLNTIKHSPENDILVENRLHLTQSMVKELLPFLQKFAETGEIV